AKRWARRASHLARAVLARRWPEQARLVVEALEGALAGEPTLAIERLLDALDTLAKRVASGKAKAGDPEALAALAERGITATEGKRLRALVAAARGAIGPPPGRS